MIATIVDTTALWQTVLASAGAGIGVSFGLLAVVALLVTAGAIVVGVVVMASK